VPGKGSGTRRRGPGCWSCIRTGSCLLPRKGLVSTEAADLVPWISYRQLDFWCSKGYVHGATSGSGSPRVFRPAEKRVLVVMARLVRAGFPAALAAKVARVADEAAGPDGTCAVQLTGED